MEKISLTRFQKKLAIRGGILVIVSLAFLVIVIMPLSQKLSRITGEVEGRFGESQRVQNIILDSKRSAEKLQKILIRLEEYQNKIPHRTKLSEALDYLASEAQTHNLEVLSLQPLKDRTFRNVDGTGLQHDGYEVQDVEIDLKARGNYLDLGRYVSALETMPFKVLVKNIDVRRNAPVSDEVVRDSMLTATFRIGVLMMAPAEPS